MYHDFFWDLDGTLYDTYPKMVQAFLETLQHFGESVDGQNVYEIMRQESLGAAFDFYAVKFDLKRDDLADFYYPREKQIQQPQLFTGVQEVLEQVTLKGGRNFLLTHRNEQSLVFMENDGVKDLFSDFVTAAQPFPRKPDPTSLNYLIDGNQVERSTAVMVGDRNLDIDAGHNARIAGILFDPDDLIEVTSNPDQTIQDMTEIIPLIK